ncbi:protein DBF4 homolog B [Tiliqua scincoides]|uniref:protein DBF4 homolog B n=1 Tax=Tiliqua scincoides TaxID=71010 RepID=UPI0034621877
MADGTLDQQQSIDGVDCQGLKSQIKPARKHKEAVSSAGSHPLAGKSFYLDLPSGKNLKFLTETVQGLGGVVESFLSKEVSYVISSSREARQERWAAAHSSVVSGDTPAGAEPGPGCTNSLHKSMGTALISRGKELLHKAIRSQDNTCGNSILTNARLWGVRIMHPDELLSYIRRLKSKKHPSKTKVKLLASRLQPRKVARLRPPFLKIEDESRHLRPLLRHFKNFPEPCFLPLRKCSPFEPLQTSACSKAPEGKLNSPLCHVVPKKKRGHCECCQEVFMELQAHLQSPQHKEFALDPTNYALVDSLISKLTNDFSVFSWSSPPRVSPATNDNVPSGFQMEAAVGTPVLPSSQPASVEDSVGRSVSPEGFAHLLEDQDFLQLTELGTFNTPMPFASQSLGSPLDQSCGGINSGPDKAGKVIANVVASSEADSGAAPQWTWPLKQPTVLPCKHKKRQVLAEEPMNEKLQNGKLLSEDQQVATVGCPFTDPGDGQTTPEYLGLPTGALYTPSSLCVSIQFPQEGLTCYSYKPVAIDASPVQELDEKQVSAVCLYKKPDTQTPCNFTSPNIELKSMPGSPMDSCIVSKVAGSVAQRCSPCTGISELAQGVLPQQPSPGPSPCQPLPTEAQSSSSETEWDGPLLCVLAGASSLPFKCPVDAELLGTCVSLQDSSYESSLCSVLWKTP